MHSLIPEAHAQAAEAISAGSKAADVFLDRGVLGAVCVFLILLLAVAGLVIRHLYNDLKTNNGQIVSYLAESIKASQGTLHTLERVEDILKELKATLDTRGAAIDGLSRQFEVIASDLRHGLGNLSSGVEGLARWAREVDRVLPNLMPRRERGGDP